MKDVFDDTCPSLGTIERWYLQFKRGVFSLEDDPRSGRPSDVVTPKNIELVREAIMKDQHITYQQLAQILNIFERSIGRFLYDHLHVRKVCSFSVPHELSKELRELRVKWCKTMLKKFKSGKDNTVYSIPTSDESWIYFDDIPTKSQNKVWVFENEAPPTHAKQSRSVGKRMVVSFFRQNGLVANVFLNKQKTLTARWYMEECLPQMISMLKTLHPNSPMCLWYLNIDNAPAHRVAITHRYLEESGLKLMEHPPYSTDIAPCDFGFFPYAKIKLKGLRFRSDEEFIVVWNNVCDSIGDKKKRMEALFDESFERMEKCISCGGNYFKKQ
ncbi:hypothetical protein KPH14_007665 [Odynerus spinipes]|uniref:Transposase n=1 Tax=Odynerus spinipes TaxID=1348599 RepID=A0AAD9VML3_9HYME|nr:hypothetical protein KPH14_007665 [Odynerus spinipes]